MRLFAVAVLVLVLGVAACGKRGSPQAPGPPDAVIWPKQYPNK